MTDTAQEFDVAQFGRVDTARDRDGEPFLILSLGFADGERRFALRSADAVKLGTLMVEHGSKIPVDPSKMPRDTTGRAYNPAAGVYIDDDGFDTDEPVPGATPWTTSAQLDEFARQALAQYAEQDEPA